MDDDDMDDSRLMIKFDSRDTWSFQSIMRSDQAQRKALGPSVINSTTVKGREMHRAVWRAQHIPLPNLDGIAIMAKSMVTGKSFNAFSAALLTRMLAAVCGYQAGELIWQGGDVHLYLNHAALVEEQLSRTPSGNPKLKLLRAPDNIFDFRIEDFEVTDYYPQAHISAPVAV